MDVHFYSAASLTELPTELPRPIMSQIHVQCIYHLCIAPCLQYLVNFIPFGASLIKKNVKKTSLFTNILCP